MKKFLLLFAGIILLYTNLEGQVPAVRTKYNFNSSWKVFMGDPAGAEAVNFNDANWKPVTLPNAWNEDEAFKKDIRDLSTGIAWYRKKFRPPATAAGQKVFLEFEGIRQAGDFYLNGKHIGKHENGINSFGFDITELVRHGADNVIAARIDNDWDYREKATNTKFQWEDKNFNVNYGGINKNVFLHTIPRVYQTLPLYTHLGTKGVYIYADQFNVPSRTARIHAESEIRNDGNIAQTVQYEVRIIDAAGKTLKSFAGEKKQITPGTTAVLRASAPLSGINFWSWGYGYLYTVQTMLKVDGRVVDLVNTKTGFRKTAFKEGMIYLNDRVIMVHGYAQRTSNEWPSIGLSVPAWLSDYSNGLMVENNANLVRWMHITPWKQDVESCDRVGLLQAMPAGDAERDVEGVRWEQRMAVMCDAIIYNRNNPSIIFYECGNESISEAHMKEMKEIRDLYDPFGGRAIGSREMLNSKLAEYGGEMLYTNKSANIPLWAMEYSRDEGLRKYWDDFTPPFHKDGDGPLHNGQNAATYNRNMESHAVENVKRWFEFWNERPGTGKRVSSGGVNIVFSETNTHHRGAENYRRSGEVDGMRIIKQNFYANQVMWDGWVEPSQKGIRIIGHWNYQPGVKKDIFVVAAAHKVELKVNGQSLGFGEKTDGFLFTFKNVEWKPGTISATGYDPRGQQVSNHQIKTVGKPVSLRLSSIKRPFPFLADGHDLVLLEVEVVDAAGQRCPTALDMINFSLEGPAEWRGGMAQGPDNYILSKNLPVEGGVNRVLIRSTTRPGKITVRATANGLKPSFISFDSKAVVIQGGLSTRLPSEGLPSYLKRGPTPNSASFRVSRIPVPVVGAIAGAHSDSTAKSYDDNELSDWVNDGKLSTAWIEYELEKETEVSEVVLKLNNFRSRSYPLIISIDGKEIFKGKTPTTLGYCTLICQPQKGKKLRIKLTVPSETAGGTVMTEVTGKKLDDGVARDDANAKGTLSIIEAEIYEKVKN
jgi:beta-galactosidase